MSHARPSRLVLGLVGSAIVTVGGLLVLHWTHALVLGALPLFYALVADSLETAEDPVLEAETVTRAPGRRDELSTLVWAMRSRSGLVPPRTMRRVGNLAAALLAHHGVVAEGGFPLVVAPADAARARTLLGAGAATLLDATPATETRPRDLDRCLAALEALDPTLLSTTTITAPHPPTTGGPR